MLYENMKPEWQREMDKLGDAILRGMEKEASMTAVDVLTNGHTKDHAPPALEQLTFSTGVTVTIRPLATMTVQTINAAVRKDPKFKQPEPPQQLVDTIDGVSKIANPSDPAYLEALKAWEARFGEEVGARFLKVLALRGVVMDIDAAWVADFRADMDAAGAPVVDLSDAEIYLYHCAAPTPEDMELLQRKALRQAQPTEEAVQAHVDTFRGDIPGA
jgi:hypothetical protein